MMDNFQHKDSLPLIKNITSSLKHIWTKKGNFKTSVKYGFKILDIFLSSLSNCLTKTVNKDWKWNRADILTLDWRFSFEIEEPLTISVKIYFYDRLMISCVLDLMSRKEPWSKQVNHLNSNYVLNLDQLKANENNNF